MNFRENEKSRAPDVIRNIIKGQGGGLYAKRPYPFVLQERTHNLWVGIRKPALDYFRDHNIAWWSDDGRNIPTGHILSSQVACVNHLFWLKDTKDAAQAVISRVNSDFIDVGNIDGGYVDFEVVGKQNYLGERSHQRGANATAFDAAMIGVRRDGGRVFVAIEWKYTESYGLNSKYKPERARIYDQLIFEKDSPIKIDDPSALYYEPLYQLMRQTLLASKIARAQEHGCTDYVHVHVIPKGNTQLLMKNPSPGLEGSSLGSAWRSALRVPEKYIILDPEYLLAGVTGLHGTAEIRSYLSGRYWQR